MTINKIIISDYGSQIADYGFIIEEVLWLKRK
jgi:hypothetical protein